MNDIVMNLAIRKIDKRLPDLVQDEKGNWIDLYTSRATVVENDRDEINKIVKRKGFIDNSFTSIEYKAGDVIVLEFGIAVDMPDGYEAELATRSSEFANYGLILTNAPGIIDTLYRGNNDEWKGVMYATRSGKISKYDRLLHFRITKSMPKLDIKYVEKLTNEDRGGYGTSGQGTNRTEKKPLDLKNIGVIKIAINDEIKEKLLDYINKFGGDSWLSPERSIEFSERLDIEIVDSYEDKYTLKFSTFAAIGPTMVVFRKENVTEEELVYWLSW